GAVELVGAAVDDVDDGAVEVDVVDVDVDVVDVDVVVELDDVVDDGTVVVVVVATVADGVRTVDGPDGPCRTLAAAAVTPPRTRELASATPASLRADARTAIGPFSRPLVFLHELSLRAPAPFHRSGKAAAECGRASSKQTVRPGCDR